jgi:Secretion system C-terminal sorting domain
MKYIYFVTFFLLTFFQSRAQSCFKENQPTSTDWQKYVAGNRDYPNNWNWTLPGQVHPVYTQSNLSNPSFNIELPYFCTKILGSGSCNNSNTLKYEFLSRSNIKQDIYPEDGWELLIKDFGTPNTIVNGVTIQGREQPNPYYLLYNKYTGRMKVFYAVVGTPPANSSYLEISFFTTSKKRAVFAHVTPIAQTLEEFYPSNNFKILNDYASSSSPTAYYWLVGEVQTAYDPCTCTSNDNYAISVKPVLVTTTQIDAKIEGQIKQPSLASGGKVTGEGDGTTSFGKLLTGAIEAGSKSYTNYEGFSKQATVFLDSRNKAYKDKLVKDWWDNTNSGPRNPAQNEVEFLEFMKRSDNVKTLSGVENLDKYKLLGKIPVGALKGIASALPYVGTAIGLYDFFANGGSNTAAQTSPPLVFDVGLSLTGTMTSPIPKLPVQLDLPGSQASNNASISTFYNRTLGVINILKAPDMEFFELKVSDVKVQDQEESNQNQCEKGKDEFDGGFDLAKTQAPKQFKLKEDVKYLLNPATNTEVDFIDACFVVEYRGDQPLFIYSPYTYNTIDAVPVHSKIYNRDLSLTDRIKYIEESGWDLEYVSKGYPTAQGSIIRFRSKYVPLQCLKNLNFMLWGGKMPTMYIKMLVKLKRKDNPTAEQITQILTYNMSNSLIKATKNPLEGSVSHILKAQSISSRFGLFDCGGFQYTWVKYGDFRYDSRSDFWFNPSDPGKDFIINSLPLSNPYYKYPTNATYSNNSPSNISVTGDITINDNDRIADNVTLTALGTIFVGKGVTFGNNVQLISGKKIDINPSTQITAGVSLRIQPSQATDIFPCTNTNIAALQATSAEIYDTPNKGCKAKRYTDSTVAALKGNEVLNEALKVSKPKNSVITNLSCAPNPFNNVLTINYEVNEPTTVAISIISTLGQVVKVLVNEKVEAGSYQINESTADLPTGVYIVSMRTPTGIKTQKVVKQNN